MKTLSLYLNRKENRGTRFSALRSVLTLLVALLATCCGALRGECAHSDVGAVRALSPLFFEALPVQADGGFSFVSRGEKYLFGIAPTEAQIVLQRISASQSHNPFDRNQINGEREVVSRTLRMRFLGANASARVQGNGLLPAQVNYFIGNDPAGWRANVPTFSGVRVEDLYPGVSLIYYGNQQHLEYDFTIAAGINPGVVALRIDGADSLKISEQGELIIGVGLEEIRQPKPECYQTVGGQRRTVTGGYRLKDPLTVQFSIGPYDRGLPLTIDPLLRYSTYFGGNFGEQPFSVKVDANGRVYVAGETLSTSNLFSAQGFTNKFSGGRINGDAFLAVFSNDASSPPLYFSYLGSSGNDGARGLAVEPTGGRAYIVGFTDSTNFPTRLPDDAAQLTNRISGVIDPIARAFPSDAFVAEIDTTASGAASLIYSTYLGGTLADVGIGIALDGDRNAYVTGFTFSTNFPVVNAYQTKCAGSNDAFVAKIGPDAHGGLLYSTYFGGTNLDEGLGIAAAGSLAFITGYTASTNFHVSANALKPFINSTTNATDAVLRYKGKVVPLDAFIAEFDTSIAGSNSLLYSSYVGGSNNDAGFRIALDASANVYITGDTTSPNFPNTNHLVNIRRGADGTNAVNFDGFLMKFGFINGAPTNYFSFQFGGARNDVGWDLALDAAGRIFVVGVTSSTNFPTTNTVGFLRATNSSSLVGGSDAFVMSFAPDASSLLYSAYLGGKQDDFGYGIAADAAGNAYVVGQTRSTNFPVMAISPTAVPFQGARNGTNDAFLASISLEETLALVRANVGTADLQFIWPAAPEFVLEKATNRDNPVWTPSPYAPKSSNGWTTVTITPTNPVEFFRLKR